MISRDLSKGRAMRDHGTSSGTELPDDLPEVGDEALAAAIPLRSRFEQMLRTAPLRESFGRQAELQISSRGARSYPGFSALLGVVLPTDPIELSAISYAFGFPASTLEALRDGTLVATEVQAEPVVQLAVSMNLDADTFLELVRQDVESRNDVVGGSAALERLAIKYASWDIPQG